MSYDRRLHRPAEDHQVGDAGGDHGRLERLHDPTGVSSAGRCAPTALAAAEEAGLPGRSGGTRIVVVLAGVTGVAADEHQQQVAARTGPHRLDRAARGLAVV